jgi:hypothetical protein
MSDTSLVTVEARAVTKPMSAMEMEEQIRAYFAMQQVLDKALPGAIMEIQGHLFRKKSYWRAIAVAFGIELEMVSEDRFESSGGGWGWKALYKATLPNGKSMTGDGICTSNEKRGNSCTEHNVRSHCHTRAKNRAIADLVGFGEVSAEEVERDDVPQPTVRAPAPRENTSPSAPVVTRTIYRQALAPIWKEAQKKGMPKDFWTSLLKTMHINATDVVDEATLDRLRVGVADFTSVDVPKFDGPSPAKGYSMKDCEELAKARNIGQNQFSNLKAEANSNLLILFKDLEDCVVES